MPGVKRVREREESENDDGDQESDSERSSEEESTSSDGTDSDDSSELDEEECERRRGEYLSDLTDLERQFTLLREQERVTQVESKLEEVKVGHAAEYQGPLEELKEAMGVRLEVACILREFRLQNISNKHEAEALASRQNFENEKVMLWDSIESELEEKIRRLEEDRNNVDVTSEVWAEQNLHRRHKRHRQGSSSSADHRRRKPATVAGPYIVYMLREPDILDDWTAIKKALTASKRKTKFGKIGSPRHMQEAFSL